MSSLISEAEVAAALDVETRTVRLRAEKELWTNVKKRKQGGSQRFYVFALLPTDVLAKIAIYRNKRG